VFRLLLLFSISCLCLFCSVLCYRFLGNDLFRRSCHWSSIKKPELHVNSAWKTLLFLFEPQSLCGQKRFTFYYSSVVLLSVVMFCLLSVAFWPLWIEKITYLGLLTYLLTCSDIILATGQHASDDATPLGVQWLFYIEVQPLKSGGCPLANVHGSV